MRPLTLGRAMRIFSDKDSCPNAKRLKQNSDKKYFSQPPRSEHELQPKLHHAAPSGTDERVAGNHVGCRAPTAEVRVAGVIEPGSHRGAVGVGEVRVIEYVKEFDAELGAHAFF